jgi:O-acetyl-ADP-ribose deacetylase (regulator of RNase III)
MQTLTISVNCVGVMGKGLASRAKYQFPDMYVKYQDVCRDRLLQLGKPYLYKREASLDLELADEPFNLRSPNAATWLLLFPTKHHWKQKADMEGIENGLKWIVEHSNNEGIKSLALPALGCGLGQLDWKDVGPMMCRYLSRLKIPVWVYLPTEAKVPDEFINKKYLLG